MKFPTIIKGSICVLGLVGAANLLAAPANAGQASARGAATVSRADGVTQTVSGEVVLPSGMHFTGTSLTVAPTIATPGTATASITSLLLTTGTPTANLVGSNPIEEAIATILLGTNSPAAAGTGAVNATNIQDAAAIIKAAGGVNGFAGLE